MFRKIIDGVGSFFGRKPKNKVVAKDVPFGVSADKGRRVARAVDLRRRSPRRFGAASIAIYYTCTSKKSKPHY